MTFARTKIFIGVAAVATAAGAAGLFWLVMPPTAAVAQTTAQTAAQTPAAAATAVTDTRNIYSGTAPDKISKLKLKSDFSPNFIGLIFRFKSITHRDTGKRNRRSHRIAHFPITNKWLDHQRVRRHFFGQTKRSAKAVTIIWVIGDISKSRGCITLM